MAGELESQIGALHQVFCHYSFLQKSNNWNPFTLSEGLSGSKDMLGEKVVFTNHSID